MTKELTKYERWLKVFEKIKQYGKHLGSIPLEEKLKRMPEEKIAELFEKYKIFEEEEENE